MLPEFRPHQTIIGVMPQKQIIAFLLIFFSHLLVLAQPKSTICPRPLKTNRDFAKMTVVDTTQLRVYYAFCPLKIEDDNTYIDLQRLDVGMRFVKYYSQFVYVNDSLVSIWWRQHPNSRTGAPWLGAIGRKDKEDNWSEYEWADYFIEEDQLTEYSTMPRSLDSYNSWYTEAIPKQVWTLHDEKKIIIGYKCQRATCHFRGRDFEAWFAPDIPVKRGPWKFGGLPGLILKVYDKDNLYIFEAIGLESHRYPITRFNCYKDYHRSTREKVWKMQKAFNENWYKATGAHRTTMDAAGNMVQGEAISIVSTYSPLELE